MGYESGGLGRSDVVSEMARAWDAASGRGPAGGPGGGR
jgi:hypothetical protein